MGKTVRGKKIRQIIVKAWADEVFKRRLLNDARTVLKEEGVDVPDGLEVKALENTDKIFHFVLPPRREPGELDEEELEAVAGGLGQFSSQLT